uniref:Uncharacterized protein n=1 Tax=Cacopsylla melanoneura TaxID=428564 RepID=A0A8D8SLP6_9HEMI
MCYGFDPQPGGNFFFVCFYFSSISSFDFFFWCCTVGRLKNTQNGQTHQESWNHRKVWYQIWCLPQKNGEENGNHPTCQVYLLFLWQGCHEEILCRHLVLQEMQASGSWRSMGLQHNCSHICTISYQTSARSH